MNEDVLQIIAFFSALLLLSWPLGRWMAGIYEGKIPFWLRPVERCEALFYRLMRIAPKEEMNWKSYAISALLLNFGGMLAVYALQRWQGFLPLNPQGLPAVEAYSALNTAVSFATNTNWQGYGGESIMSLLTQMVALGVQNFLSAATGMAVVLPLVRGFTRHGTDMLGNFWVDITRSILYILLPLSLLLAIALVWQGVPQTLSSPATVQLLEVPAGQPVDNIISTQTIPLGLVASQVAIKQLGTNGGGFYNVNSAHPLENPTPLSNLLQMLAIALIPMAFCFMFGHMVGDVRQGWSIFAAMLIIFVAGFGACWWAEQSGHSHMSDLGIDSTIGNMEGKEQRFGVMNSALWATTTTATSNGSVNSMHDSYTPMGGLVTLLMMQLGEIIFGGVGSGLYGMLIFVILTVFISGLLVGRLPEYLGKKIGIFEMKMVALAVLIPPLIVLLCTACAVMLDCGTASVFNPGPHGFSEILYAFSSMGNNNGSAFAGLGANVPFYNVVGSLAMLLSRFWLMVPVLALAASLARGKHIPASAGTLPTHTPLFIALLIGVILLIGVLSFFPSLVLGPVTEQLSTLQTTTGK